MPRTNRTPLRPPRIASINVRALCLLAAIALAWPLAASEARVPVRIGTHEQPDLDACLSIGEVSGPKPVMRLRVNSNIPKARNRAKALASETSMAAS